MNIKRLLLIIAVIALCYLCYTLGWTDGYNSILENNICFNPNIFG